MASPDDRRYLESHEWHKLEADGNVTIGISAFAVEELTDITYLEFEATQGPVKKGESFGEIESVKATSELYSGIDGEILEVNSEAIDNPALVNEDPYGQGWLIKLKPSDPTQLEALMSEADYEKSTGS